MATLRFIHPIQPKLRLLKPRNTIFWLLFSAFQLFSFSAFTAAAADLGELQKSFMARYDEANATRDQGLKRLQASYLGALQRHMDKVKASGKLERVIPIRDEISAVETGADPLPELPNKADRDLKKLRETYLAARTKVRENHAKTLTDLADKMNAALESEETDLTKAGKIDEALAAKRMRETLANDAGIKAARELLGSGEDSTNSLRLGEWLPLLEQKMEVIEKGRHPVGRLSAIVRETGPSAIQMMAGGTKVDPETVLVSPSPCRVRFKPAQAVGRIRGTVVLTHSHGVVTCRIFAGGEKIFEESLERGHTTEKFDLKFDTTKLLELEVDERGHPGNDWVMWTDLEVR